MKEYIERESTIETIRKAVVYEAIADLAERAIEAIPAADVREVVFCRDCAYWTEHYNKSYHGHFCERIAEFMQEDDFCSCGERPNCGADMRGENND